MTKKAIDGIYLRPNTNKQGGHIVINLSTGKPITRNKMMMVPLLAVVKEKVEEMALEQGVENVKFINCTGVE